MGCCLVAALAFLGPRIVLVFMWLFTTYLNRPYPVFIVPLLGFFFLPWTTLAYAWAVNNGYGLSRLGPDRDRRRRSSSTSLRTAASGYAGTRRYYS